MIISGLTSASLSSSANAIELDQKGFSCLPALKDLLLSASRKIASITNPGTHGVTLFTRDANTIAREYTSWDKFSSLSLAHNHSSFDRTDDKCDERTSLEEVSAFIRYSCFFNIRV